jgi:hypothetical protein
VKALTARGVEVVKKADLLESSSLKALYDRTRGAFFLTNSGIPLSAGARRRWAPVA